MNEGTDESFPKTIFIVPIIGQRNLRCHLYTGVCAALPEYPSRQRVFTRCELQLRIAFFCPNRGRAGRAFYAVLYELISRIRHILYPPRILLTSLQASPASFLNHPYTFS